jgi:hypothetical protein
MPCDRAHNEMRDNRVNYTLPGKFGDAIKKIKNLYQNLPVEFFAAHPGTTDRATLEASGLKEFHDLRSLYKEYPKAYENMMDLR